MNILFLGGGRRYELAKRFKDRGYTLFFYELDRKVPVSELGTVIRGLNWTSQYILEDIETMATDYNIDLIIPLFDEAVYVASRLKEEWKDKVIVAPSIPTAKYCFDKKYFSTFMETNFPQIYPFVTHNYPIIAKPRKGYGSRGIVEIVNEMHFTSFLNDHEYNDYVFQKKVVGKEYSVDAYFDPDSKFVDAIVRERIRVGAGEVITSKTMSNHELTRLTREVGEKIRLVGPTNTQFIVDENTEIPYMIEINCRFGGGWTLSLEANLDAISLIERDYFNRDFDYLAGYWKEGLLLERSSRDHYYENSN